MFGSIVFRFCCGLILGMEREGGRARARAHRWAAARAHARATVAPDLVRRARARALSHQLWCDRRAHVAPDVVRQRAPARVSHKKIIVFIIVFFFNDYYFFSVNVM